MKFVLTGQELQALDLEQKRAVVEALVTAVLADGKADPAEITQFNTELARAPWGVDNTVMAGLVAAARLKVASLKAQPEIVVFVKSIAARLPSPAVREKVFRAMASVMYVDRNMTVPERNVLIAFAAAFGVSEDRIKDIKAEVVGN